MARLLDVPTPVSLTTMMQRDQKREGFHDRLVPGMLTPTSASDVGERSGGPARGSSRNRHDRAATTGESSLTGLHGRIQPIRCPALVGVRLTSGRTRVARARGRRGLWTRIANLTRSAS